METSKFKTKTELEFRNNGHTKNVYEVALDIGYSAVKLFGPCVVARFPSYAKKVGPDFSFLSNVDDLTIIYTDNKTKERWLVGETAQSQISRNDTSVSEAALYGRERYGTPMFKVLARVGLALGMLDKVNGKYVIDFKPEEKTLVVQTGLPEKYLSMDKEYMTEILAGTHDFTLSIGSTELHFNFDLSTDNIYVMSQPTGTLFSICYEKNGSAHADAAEIMHSSALIFDPGFGTLDIFPFKNGTVDGNGETFPDLGMKRVMQDTVNRLRKEEGVDISVPALQQHLEAGYINHIDRKLNAKKVEFGNILRECNRNVCEEAIETLLSIYDISDYKYVIITGGTGAAWFQMIKDRFQNAIDAGVIQIINGNRNDNLAFVYSNVRGYYLYRHMKLVSLYGKEA